jgi:lysophospholipase L1-like esterase
MRTLRIFLATVLTAVLATACGSRNDTTGPSPIPSANSAVNYTAIGASDAIGFGSSVSCVPWADCPNGRGYVQVATRELRSRGFTVNLNNLGLPAAVLSKRVQNLALQYGRDVLTNFMDQQIPYIQPNSTLITIFAGGNDVNAITSALGSGAGGADRAAFINNQITAFGQDFTTMLQTIRERVPTARIVVLNLPNMAAMPFLARASRDQRLAAQMLSVGMTRIVFNPLASTGVMVIDLMCDPRAYQASTYSSDGFHPADTGYAWIAAEVVAATTTTYRPPLSSCAQMTAVQ